MVHVLQLKRREGGRKRWKRRKMSQILLLIEAATVKPPFELELDFFDRCPMLY